MIKAWLLVVGRGTSVVLVTPNPVPDTRNKCGADEDDGGVVDSGGVDRESRGHAKQRKGQQRPSY